MIRIPNPGSDINIFVRIFKELFEELKTKNDFGLDDISGAMIKRSNVSSQGAIGSEALRRSTRKDRSRDPIYNQSKAYAELYRTLGWLQSTSSALRFSFSLLGEHIAAAKNPNILTIECLLGLAYPNDVLEIKGDQSVRIFLVILRTMKVLDGKISRDEMIVGPMSIDDDRSQKSFSDMISILKQCRNSSKSLASALSSIEKSRGITKTTMENYTRFPIAAIQWAEWAIKRNGYFELTALGKEQLTRVSGYKDVRLSDFRKFHPDIRNSIIRLTFYDMLGRSNFNLDPIKEQIKSDIENLRKIKFDLDNPLLFSPFQQIARQEVNQAFDGENIDDLKNVEKPSSPDAHPMSSKGKRPALTRLLFEISNETIPSSKERDPLTLEIEKVAIICKKDVNSIVELIAKRYLNSNKEVFYPLVVNLFRLLEFDCRMSRLGVNYERADAIIIDPQKSIPIEVKSPGEETEISIKGIRQALENKVVLLSRKNYPTDIETTSLLVGYNPPNERSEVHELIEDIYKTYGLKIGVIDFRSLLRLVVSSMLSKKKIVITNFHTLKGVILVSRA